MSELDASAPATSRLFRLPKAELHVHLDGSVRPGTLLELAAERGVTLPVTSAAEVASYMLVSDAASLEEYLERFDVTIAVMQDAQAIERVAYELAVDHAAENVRYVETRFCPLLHAAGGLTPSDAVHAALTGLRRAEESRDVQAGLIVCALRTHDPAQTLEMAEVAVEWRDRGVCGFDIAGAEAGHPVADHAEAFTLAAAERVPITVHAGEGAGPASIRQALDFGRADRIGHGTRLHEDATLLERVRSSGVPLEMCITSNVQTRVVRTAAEHPVRRYLHAGIPVTLCTDNRLMSGVTLTGEYALARDALGCTWPELVTIARAGFSHAFVEPEVRDGLLERFEAEVAKLD